jgi:hypothetical protein
LEPILVKTPGAASILLENAAQLISFLAIYWLTVPRHLQRSSYRMRGTKVTSFGSRHQKRRGPRAPGRLSIIE